MVAALEPELAVIAPGEAARLDCEAETPAAVMLKALDVPAVSPVAVACNAYPVPALSMLRSLNVATPDTADLILVPASVPPLGLVEMATVTLPV